MLQDKCFLSFLCSGARVLLLGIEHRSELKEDEPQSYNEFSPVLAVNISTYVYQSFNTVNG